MTKTLEIEFKTLLSASEFARTCNYFQIQSTDFNIQTNYYFDTSDFQLKQKNMGLRVRLFSYCGELTLKVPQKVGLLETTDSLTASEALTYIQQQALPEKGNVANELAKLGINRTDLKIIGHLKTNRAEIEVPQGLLALDESWYHQKHDFELELEVTDFQKGKQNFHSLLDILNIKPISAPNKVQRMMTHLDNKN